MTQGVEMLPVEQSDRALFLVLHPVGDDLREDVENGAYDEADAMQAIARHRIAHTHPAATGSVREAAQLTVADAAYHLGKYRPHCLEALKAALAAAPTPDAAASEAGEVERLVRDVERLAAALEGVQDRCRRASARFNVDQSVPSVRQMIALDSISGNVAHHLAGIDLVRANARAALTRQGGAEA